MADLTDAIVRLNQTDPNSLPIAAVKFADKLIAALDGEARE